MDARLLAISLPAYIRAACTGWLVSAAAACAVHCFHRATARHRCVPMRGLSLIANLKRLKNVALFWEYVWIFSRARRSSMTHCRVTTTPIRVGFQLTNDSKPLATSRSLGSFSRPRGLRPAGYMKPSRDCRIVSNRSRSRRWRRSSRWNCACDLQRQSPNSTGADASASLGQGSARYARRPVAVKGAAHIVSMP